MFKKKKVLIFVLMVILLSACTPPTDSLATSTSDYVAPILQTTTLGGNFGAGIFWALLALIAGGAAAYMLRGFKLASVMGFFVATAIVFGIPAAIASYVVIQPGEVGVQVRQGNPREKPLMEGPHWVVPFYDEVRVLSTRSFTFSLVADGVESFPATRGSEQYRSFYQKFTTLDGVEGSMPYIMRAKLNPSDAPSFVSEYGTLENGIVQLLKTPAISLVRDILRGMDATTVVTTIDTHNASIMTTLKEEATAGGLTLIDFAFSRPEMGAWGAERDLTATTAQQALTAENAVEIAKQQADADIATKAGENTVAVNTAIANATIAETKALGLAEAAKIEADATAYTTTTVANATAEANTAIAQTLTPNFIEYFKFLQWNGELSLYSGSSTPLLQLPAQ